MYKERRDRVQVEFVVVQQVARCASLKTGRGVSTRLTKDGGVKAGYVTRGSKSRTNKRETTTTNHAGRDANDRDDETTVYRTLQVESECSSKRTDWRRF